MDDVKRNVLATGAVLTVLAAATVGHISRTRLEMGADVPNASSLNRPGILASNEKAAPLTEAEYFYQLTLLLQREYVDPVPADGKLASGAVRGMVGSLIDPESFYMNPEQFGAYRRQLAGQIEGIGVEVEFQFDENEIKKAQRDVKEADPMMLIPDLVVASVLPDSPAAKAGMKPGDRIEKVGGKWLISARDVRRIRDVQARVSAGSINSDELAKLRKEFAERADKSIPPNKGRDGLMQGTSGDVEVTWHDGTASRTAKIGRAKLTLGGLVEVAPGQYELHFVTGAAAELSKLTLDNPITFDLRNSVSGDFSEMKKCLERLVPAGTYGELSLEKPGAAQPFKTTSGPSRVPSYTLVVDERVHGAALVFAQALESRGLAKLQGKLPDTRERWIEVIGLPDGSGYTLATGEFHTQPTGKVALK